MIRNAKKYGVLTTVNTWVFLMRENHGKLWMTGPIDCQLSDPPFTILQALYYMSALAASQGHLVETDENGNPVVVALANSKYPHPAPPSSGQQTESATQSSAAATVTYPLPSGQYYQLAPLEFHHGIILEPWKRENCCGGKSFRGRLMPDDITVILKLWDGYTYASEDRDKEAQIYMHLQSLWGKEIPRLICSADVDFCYGIILEDVQVLHYMLTAVSPAKGTHISSEHMDDTLRTRVMVAYKALHKQRVLHGDIRRENVVVLKDRSVRIIDFDNASILSEDDADLILREDAEIASMLDELMKENNKLIRNGSMH
jgi:serine/threonine protein kinase